MKYKTKSDRKRQIRETAQNLFREKGYKATSMRDLASAVGIEPASLYNHIRSKEQILKEICYDMAEQFFEAQSKVDPNLRADEKLKEAIRANIQVITNNLDASAVFLHEWRFLKEEHLVEFKTMRNKYEAIFVKIVQDGIKNAIFREVDVKFYILSLFSSMNWIYEWYQPNGKYTVEEISNMLIDLLFDGIKTKHSPS